MFTLFEKNAKALLSQEVSLIMNHLSAFQPSQLSMTPFGDSLGMQLIQKKQFEKVLEMLKNKEIFPSKNACNMTFAQMALMCGASGEQCVEFEQFDTAAGINPETRTSNAGHSSLMIAANQLQLDFLKHCVQNSENHFPWQKSQSFLNRTVAHALYLPSLIKGDHNEDEYIAVTSYLLEQGVKFNTPDAYGFTAIDYALLYHPHLTKMHALITTDHQQSLACPDPNQIQDFWGCTELHRVVLQGTLEQLQILLKEKASALANSTQQTPLHSLCCKPSIDPQESISKATCLISLEKEEGISMNQNDIHGFLPLHHAAAFGQVELFKWLMDIQYGNKKQSEQFHTLQDAHDRTVAHDICMSGPGLNEHYLELTKIILTQCGPTIFMQPDRFGIPPVLYAYYCKPFLIPFILEAFLTHPENLAEYLSSAKKSVAELVQQIPTIDMVFEKINYILHEKHEYRSIFQRFIHHSPSTSRRLDDAHENHLFSSDHSYFSGCNLQ